MSNQADLPQLSPLQLEQVIPLATSEKRGGSEAISVQALTSLSPDTIKRRFPHFVIRLSPGRLGVKLRNVLKINEGSPP